MSGTNHLSQYEAPSLRVKTGVYDDGRPIYTFYATPGPAAAVGPVFNVSDYGATGDGVTDDTAAIQATITACGAAGGGTVYVPAGVYLISSTLTISADNVQMVGASWGAQLMAAAAFAANTPMLYVTAPATGFRYGIKVADLRLFGNSVASLNGIRLDSTYHALLDHLRMEYVLGTAFDLNGSSSYFGAYTNIVNCEVSNGGAGTGMLTTNHEFITVQGGLFAWYNSAGGIAINTRSTSTRILGVTFDQCDTAVQVFFCQATQVCDCQFDRGTTHFILLEGSAQGVVTGNSFHTFVGTGAKNIIDVNNSANATNIVANNAVIPSSGWTGGFAVEVAGTGAGNTYVNNETAGLAITLVSGIARGNRGYNPVGHAVAQPAVPATTVAATNTTGVDCMVYVTGGTVTAIAVGGTATGLTSGAFHVLAGSTITLTYSVAPTWQWFGE